jgi:5-methylcytosine-specific restriction protein A
VSRSVAEWIGASDDAPVPPRVRLRLFEACGGRCQLCTRQTRAGDRWVADHIQAIINGGANRETNLQIICDWCDRKVKTPADVAQKSKEYKKRLRDRGIKKPSRMPGGRDSNIKIKMDGTVVDRRTGLPIERGRNV